MSSFLYKDSESQNDSCLILCIEEQDNISISSPTDTRLFIGWSYRENDYFVRGKRQDIGSKEFVPYAFHCNNTNNLYDFIEFVMDPLSNTSIILYNYNTKYMDEHESKLTYEFFEENMDRNYEIASYDEVKLDRNQLRKYLRMLKNMYNWES